MKTIHYIPIFHHEIFNALICCSAVSILTKPMISVLKVIHHFCLIEPPYFWTLI